MTLRTFQEHPSQAKQRICDMTRLNLLNNLGKRAFFRQKIDLYRRRLYLRTRFVSPGEAPLWPRRTVACPGLTPVCTLRSHLPGTVLSGRLSRMASFAVSWTPGTPLFPPLPPRTVITALHFIALIIGIAVGWLRFF
jgi:hypothetical protein